LKKVHFLEKCTFADFTDFVKSCGNREKRDFRVSSTFAKKVLKTCFGALEKSAPKRPQKVPETPPLNPRVAQREGAVLVTFFWGLRNVKKSATFHFFAKK
jgi:hypothetical protein